jgi:hypothetical protein
MRPLILLAALCLLVSATNAKPRVFTKKFAAAVIVAGLATAADVEVTAHCVKNPACIEGNFGVYGTRPSRAKLYSINIPVTGLTIFLAYAMQHEGFDKTWWVPLAPGIALHSYAAVHGIGVMHRAERLCPAGTACTFLP